MTDEWTWWRDALAGKKPTTTPGTPHSGFYIAKSYFSIPYAAKRVLCDCPVAIWKEGDEWRARRDDIGGISTLGAIENVDELFARCCENPITHERYREMVANLEAYRNE